MQGRGGGGGGGEGGVELGGVGWTEGGGGENSLLYILDSSLPRKQPWPGMTGRHSLTPTSPEETDNKKGSRGGGGCIEGKLEHNITCAKRSLN